MVVEPHHGGFLAPTQSIHNAAKGKAKKEVILLWVTSERGGEATWGS